MKFIGDGAFNDTTNDMTIKELYDNLYDRSTPRISKLFIETYEKNYVLISNVDLTNLSDYEYTMWLTADYAILLEEKGYLQKGIEYIDKAINLFENYPNYRKEKLFDIEYYELLIFHKARALYNLKKYNASLSMFKELDKAFPNNDKYLCWVNGIRNQAIDRLTWIATGIMFAVMMLISFFKGKNIMFDKIIFWLLFSSFLFFIVCFLFNVIRRIRNKIITSHNRVQDSDSNSTLTD